MTAVPEFDGRVLPCSACGLYFASLGGGPPSEEKRLVVWNWREESKLAEKTLDDKEGDAAAAAETTVIFSESQFTRLTTCGEWMCRLGRKEVR